jgi:hypothetical protein
MGMGAVVSSPLRRLRGLPAVHLGDGDVHQDEVGHLFAGAADTLLAVAGLDDAVADVFEDGAIDDEVVLVVLDQQDRSSDCWS